MSAMNVSGVSAAPQSPPVPESSSQTAASQNSPRPERPSLYEMIQDAREKADAARDRYTVKSPVRYGDAPIEAYARLSRARTQAQVTSAAGYARRRILQLQSALRQDDGENAQQIKAAITQLRKAVSRAGKKKRNLAQEQLSERRRKKAEEAKQRQKAQRLRQELNKTRALRFIRENGYIHEAVIDSRLQSQLAATRLELRNQAQQLSAAAAPSLDAAVQGYAAAAPEAAAPDGGAICAQA